MTDETTPQDDAAMPPASTGSVCEPVAWLVTGDGYEYATLLKEHAEVVAEEEDGVVVPLCRSPTLTDAEREILPVISKTIRGRGWRDWSDVIDGLLERLGGGR